MFKRIDNKLKGLAIIIFWGSVIGGGLWFLLSFKNYIDLANTHYLYRLSFGMSIYPIVILLIGIIASYLIYGFGELISYVRNIDGSL